MRRSAAFAALLCACSSQKSAPAPAAGSDASATAAAAPGDGAPAAPAPERWAGTAVVGAALKDFVVTFTGPTAGSFEEGSKTAPLANVAVSADHLAFDMKQEHFDLARTGDQADGKITIAGEALTVRLVKLAAGEAPRSAFDRPQTPQPPFPYTSRDLVVDAPDGGKLAGTLTLPQGTGPFPAVLLLSGSGQEDRDETIFGHKPFLVIADHLARAGIATFRFDDRGTGQTVGAVHSLDTEIDDAGAVVDELKKQPELDPARLGVLGHSAAGMVAPNVALKHPVAFIVLLAGCTLDGRAYAAYQTEQAVRASGADEATLKAQRETQDRITAAALKGPDAVRAALIAMVTPQLEAQLGRKPTDDELAQAIAKPLAETTDPWTVSYFRIDPRVAWKKLHLPVLLLVGSKDTQVPADLTIPALQAVVPSELLTAQKLDGLNHLFQHAQTGQLDEYLTNEETFNPAALQTLTDWLLALPAPGTPRSPGGG